MTQLTGDETPDRLTDSWNFNVLRVSSSPSVYDVYFDWQCTQRRVCTSVAAMTPNEAITIVLANTDCLTASRFVESLGDFE